MKRLEVKTTIPEIKGGRCISAEVKDGYILTMFEIEEEGECNPISQSELECRIDPNTFAGEWLDHEPTSDRQKETLMLYKEAKAKGRLHAFTCMRVDPSILDGKLVYQKGLPPATGLSQRKWSKILKEYCPSRNSRQMTRTEFACRNLFLIQELYESRKYTVDEAWQAVCDDSRNIGHYYNSDTKGHFEPTGSREVCDFCDLANTWKFIAEDPWEEVGGFWAAGGNFITIGNNFPVADLYHKFYVDDVSNNGVGMLALD